MMSGRRTSIWLSALVVVILAAGIFLWMRYLRVPTNVAYVSEEDGGISVIDLNSLQVIRRVHPADVAPRGIGVTFDGGDLITADKDTSDIAILNTPRMNLVKRIHIGDNPEYIKFNPAGDRVFATFEPGSSAGPPAAGGSADDDDDADEPPAQIATFQVSDWATGPVSTAGKETEGIPRAWCRPRDE